MDAAGYFHVALLLTSDLTTPVDTNTGVKAYPGLTFLVLSLESYGIGSSPRLRLTLRMRNSNIAKWKE